MQNLKKIGVVGAGTMGSAIAQHFCMKGLSVTLVDLNAASVERGIKLIRQTLDEAKQKNLITEEEINRTMGRIKGSAKLEDLADCELVVEAIFEDLKIKQELFKKLGKIVSQKCILASNTSSFLITELADGLENPERVVGVHYFYHAAKNKLVEIIPGKKTSRNIVSQLKSFYSYYDKNPIVAMDAPGFAVNRYFVPWLNEAARLYEEGFGSITFIDEVARNTFRIGMGPFALMNATGVPIAQHAAEGLAQKLGAFYAPADILKAQVQAGKPWDLTDTNILKSGSNDEKTVKERLIAASLGVAAQLVSEGVADATSTDLGARIGLRWPRGPFELMNQLGLSETEEMISKLFLRWDMRLPQFPFSKKGMSRIPFQWVESYTSGNTGFIVFNMPDRMNPLSEEVVSQLSARLDELQLLSDIQTIVLAGRGKAFVAGADVKFFVDCIKKNNLNRIYQFTEFGQKVLNKLSTSPKTTVAYLNGLTLGGGLELALACQIRIGTPKTSLAFPETGIGIIPGLGGTQRTPRLIGKGLAKFLVSTGQFVDAKTALQYGLIDQLIDPVMDLEELSRLQASEKQAKPTGTNFPEAAFENFNGKPTPELFQNEVFKKYEKALRRKAPLALQKAMELVDAGEKLELEKALQLELQSVKAIFETKDALAGLSSLLQRTKPEFKGE